MSFIAEEDARYLREWKDNEGMLDFVMNPEVALSSPISSSGYLSPNSPRELDGYIDPMSRAILGWN